MSEEKNPMLPLLLGVGALLRNWWTVVAGVFVGLSIAVAALHFMPRIYEASTTIFVAPPKIPETLLRSTVTDDMSLRMAAMESMLLSRGRMQTLIEQTLGLPDDPILAERMINGVRKSIAVGVNPVRVNNNQEAGYFDLTFRHGNPQMAADVVNTLASLWLEENAEKRTERAAQTSDTLQELLSRAEAGIQEVETRIADFRRRHQFDLRENMDANLQLLAAETSTIEATRAQLQTAQRQRDELAGQIQIRENSLAGSAGTPGPGAWAINVRDARQTLADLKRRYSDKHPEVKKAQRDLDDLLAQGEPEAEPEGSTPTMAEGDSTYVLLTTRLTQLDADIVNYEKALERARNNMRSYQARIDATPKVELELSELTKGYDARKREYDRLVLNTGSAKQAELLEERQQGTQFEIVEMAVAAQIPVSPQPLLVYGICLVMGVALFAAPLFLLSMFSPKIASEAAIKELTDIPVLVTVPRIATPAARSSAQRGKIVNWALSTTSVLVFASIVLIWGA
jgi:polysaccharide chain length determinant protein (PEP-CTERM system associated)